MKTIKEIYDILRIKGVFQLGDVTRYLTTRGYIMETTRSFVIRELGKDFWDDHDYSERLAYLPEEKSSLILYFSEVSKYKSKYASFGSYVMSSDGKVHIRAWNEELVKNNDICVGEFNNPMKIYAEFLVEDLKKLNYIL